VVFHPLFYPLNPSELLPEIDLILTSDLLIDGLFGFGLSRAITDHLATTIQRINQAGKPIISIDLPSGMHTDTGEILGIAIRATHTLCLGLWKLGLFQDQSLEYLGKLELIDFDISLAGVELILSKSPEMIRVTPELGLTNIPITKHLVTHKYQQGNLLLICGSQRYAGAAILAGLGARASGVGMLSIAVPASLKPLLLHHLPEALIIACPETATGAILDLSTLGQDWQDYYSAIACGCGLSLEAGEILPAILEVDCPLLLDADGLNLLTKMGTVATLIQRQPPTILTPHWGEFKRLFPDIAPARNRLEALQQAAIASQSIVLLKGARTAIASGLRGNIALPLGGCPVAIVPESTPALARGGSGDVLTGLIAGLVAQKPDPANLLATVTSGAWWHAQAGTWAATSRTDLGVDAFTLSQSLIPALCQIKGRYTSC
jgi:ADP-dependent NAD(P)H-hydrate dehydratase / NAD(P)H-hydrate epimerase